MTEVPHLATIGNVSTASGCTTVSAQDLSEGWWKVEEWKWGTARPLLSDSRGGGGGQLGPTYQPTHIRNVFLRK